MKYANGGGVIVPLLFVIRLAPCQTFAVLRAATLVVACSDSVWWVNDCEAEGFVLQPTQHLKAIAVD